jgi:hypothetical protein
LFWASALLVAAGTTLAGLDATPGYLGHQIREFLQRPFRAIGLLFLGAGLTIYFFDVLRLLLRQSRETTFYEVDRKTRYSRDDDQFQGILEELRALRRESKSADPERLMALISAAQQDRKKGEDEIVASFAQYFLDVKGVLQDKADTADKKASILLDRGVAYSKLGIAFYVLSILAWQVVAWWHGFQAQFIYGIGSCSLLFIFIEFLSAWFLRQYRHFVDTSTYLMKVKAIFDRYMLTFLAVGGSSSSTNNVALLEILSKEIKWPDSYLLRDADVSFAREVASSIAEVASSIRKTKDSSKKE